MGHKRTFLALLLVCACLSLGLGACASKKGTPSAEGGQQIFEKQCASCHTTTRKTIVGPGLEGLLRRDFHAYLPNGMSPNDVGVRTWILKGGGDHPVFPKLSDQELDDLIEYLKTGSVTRWGQTPADTCADHRHGG